MPSCAKIVAYLYLFVEGSIPRSISSKLFAYVMIATILMGFIASYLATESKFKHSPSTCENPACYNNSDICPDAMVCEPVPLPVLIFIDDICVYIFTVEYVIRLLCCWAVPPSLLGIIPDKWPKDTPDPVLKFSEVYIRFVFKFNNLIDLATILPHYIGLASNRHVSGQSFLRSIRLLRIFKLIKRLELTKIMITTLFFCYRKAKYAILVSVLMLLGIVIFFSCLMYEVEKGTFQATVDYPHGEYFKPTFNGVGSQVSPYKSIPVAIYNAFYTLCLIGDDFAPSTWAGRMLSSMMMVIGLMALTIPVSIISTQVDMKYIQERDIRWELASCALHMAELRDDDFLFLFDLMDSNKNGTLSEEELKQSLAKAGINISIGWLTLLMEQEDCNHDGVVSREEFLAICYKLQGRAKEYKEQHAMLTDKFMRSQLDGNLEKYSETLFGADSKRAASALNVNVLQRQQSSKLWEQVSLRMHMDDKHVKVTELEMLTMFDIVDTDNSGNLDENEVFQLLQQIGIAVTIQQLRDMLSEEDCDHDGLVSKDEFIGICYKLQHNTAAYESQHTLLKERYLADKLYHDADAAGVVPSDEILRATSSKDSFNEGCWVVTGSALHINSMAEADMLQVFRDADLDHSNSLDPNEVRALLGSLGVETTGEAVIAMLLDLDCDHDGLVSPDEFLAICYKMHGRVKEYNAQLKVLRKKFVSEKLLGLPSANSSGEISIVEEDDCNKMATIANPMKDFGSTEYAVGITPLDAEVLNIREGASDEGSSPVVIDRQNMANSYSKTWNSAQDRAGAGAGGPGSGVDRVDRCRDDDTGANQCYDSLNVINTVNADGYSTGNRHSEADVVQNVVSKLLLQTRGIVDILDILDDLEEIEQTEAFGASEAGNDTIVDPVAQDADSVITAAITVLSDSSGVESRCNASAVDDLGNDILVGVNLAPEKAATSHINKNADSVSRTQILHKLEVAGLDEDCSRLRESSAQGTRDKSCVADPVMLDVESITGDELLKEEEQLPRAESATVRTIVTEDVESVDDASATSWLSQPGVLQRHSSDVWDFEGDASQELWNDNFGEGVYPVLNLNGTTSDTELQIV